MSKAQKTSFKPSASQQALLEALAGVPYLRLEKGSEYTIDDALALERAKMVRIPRKEFVSGDVSAVVVKSEARLRRLPPSNAPARPHLDTGTRVSVNRHRHGYEYGMATAVIVEHRGKGYVARDEETGAMLEIENVRDVRPLR